ncbi:MAG TPA: hypothetical protein VK535_00065, partial [Gemmatimonadales bacterium]|nr:hypothetical protein [Gemmatimonadales bacterium]
WRPQRQVRDRISRGRNYLVQITASLPFMSLHSAARFGPVRRWDPAQVRCVRSLDRGTHN